jgi:hypothetical protein
MITDMETILILTLLVLLALLAPILGTDSRDLHDPLDAQEPRAGLF